MKNYRPPTPPLPRPKDEIFDDEKNAELLKTLLQGGKPEDLQAANRLIKSMAREADKRMDLKVRFQSEVETVHNNASLLSDMLTLYSPTGTSAEEKDLMKELFESCERLRIRLFKLANDLSDNDPNMSRLFNANDELTKVINLYKERMGIVSNEESNNPLIFGSSENKQLSLLDITSPTHESLNTSNDVELLDDHFSSLNFSKENINENLNISSTSANLDALGDIFSKSKIETGCNGSHVINDILLPEPIQPLNSSSINLQKEDKSKSMGPMSAFDELNALSQSLMKKNLPNDGIKNLSNSAVSESSKASLNELQKLRSNASNGTSVTSTKSAETDKSKQNEVIHSVQPLTDINVTIDSIIPSDLKPIILYDKNDIKVILHFATNSPRIDVNVMVITIMSTNHFQVSQINFLAAVPKVTNI
jgi:ADP-ribosylation factor-binding protein GGA